MPQPKKPPKSIRAPDDVWGLVAAVAQAEGIALNAAAALCMRDGATARLGVIPSPLPKANGVTQTPEKPPSGPKGVTRKPRRKAKAGQDVTPERVEEAKAVLAEVQERVGVEPIHVERQFGPDPPIPGARLKGRWKL